MNQALHSNVFEFTIDLISNGLEIILIHPASGKSKTFFLAGKNNERAVEALTQHMNSLTDEQCASFVGFKKGKIK